MASNAQPLCTSHVDVLRWAREVHGLFGYVVPDIANKEGEPFKYQWWIMPIQEMHKWVGSGVSFEDHDLCQSSLVDRIINILNERKP